MKISVDGASLCLKFYTGNKVFTENLLKGLAAVDKKNIYYIYTFCDKNNFLTTNFFLKKLTPQFGWSKIRLSIEQILKPTDIFLALNQSIPIISARKIISFCHGLSYYFYPKFYSNSFYQLKNQLMQMVYKSNYVVVSSKKVYEELLNFFGKEIEEKIKIIPFGVPLDMMEKFKNNKKEKFFLFVGMNHPIKNIAFIKKAFKIFKQKREFADWRLILITKNISRKKLKNLYQRATGLLTASFYESFNFPVIEALSLGCPVIGLKSAIIPEFLNFVHLANNLEEFVENMFYLANQRTNLSKYKSLEIIKIFNWKRYALKLIDLFRNEN